MAIAGTARKRQSRVRHSRTAVTTTQVPITISVFPTRDHTSVMPSHRSVRFRLNAAATESSRRSIADRAPVMRSPVPITPRRRRRGRWSW